MKLAIMQPYFFPYIGYFQLISAVDKFVFYDDVNYVKSGWINRNKILIDSEGKYWTLNLKGASSFKNINEIVIGNNANKLLKTIKSNYSKAPYFHQISQLVEDVFSEITSNSLISEIAAKSVMIVSEFLGLDTEFEISSYKYSKTKGMERTQRLIKICEINGAKTYINLIGGTVLYNKDYFKKYNIELGFVKTNNIIYKQFDETFYPNLSIIDVMMHNSKDDIKEILNQYKII